QENIETVSTATSLIPASNVNSDHNSTVIIAHNNKAEPISSELINLGISNNLKKQNHLANDHEKAITPQEAPERIIDVVMVEANQFQKDKDEILPDCEKVSGSFQYLQFPQWPESIDGKEENYSFNRRMEENNPTPPKKDPKPSPVARSRNSTMIKQTQAQNKGKGKASATKPYTQCYIIPRIQQNSI
ncbi:hypothetical protein O181_057567, partial [Austropuccinia psidii MF-1]|nr:hypothetical protein [Austropuccinia psidii MF-1]